MITKFPDLLRSLSAAEVAFIVIDGAAAVGDELGRGGLLRRQRRERECEEECEFAIHVRDPYFSFARSAL